MTTPKGRAKRRYIVIPFAVLGVIFAGYSVLWIQGAGIMKQAIADFVADEEAIGHSIVMERMKVKGYPFTLRAQIDQFTWTAPGEWSWSGERLHIVTLPYDPSRLILAPRGPQTLRYGDRTYGVTADALSVGLENGKVSAETQGLNAVGQEGQITLESLKANWIENEDGTWILGAAMRQLIATPKDKPSVTAHFWNIAASGIVGDGDSLTIDATEMGLSDGVSTPPTVLKLDGTIGIDTANYPEGKINISVRNHHVLLSLLEQQGLMSEDGLERLSPTLNAFGNNDNQEIALPFRLKDGMLNIANIPLAELPTVR